MSLDSEDLKMLRTLVDACKESNCADADDFGRRLGDLYGELTPETASCLLNEIERLETSSLHINDAVAISAMADAESLAEQCRALQAENESLRSAADRYTWLRDKQTFIWLIQEWFPSSSTFTDVDAEIDAAMAKERGQ